MSLYEKMQMRRKEQDKQIEFVMFWLIMTSAVTYFGAHILAAIQQGRF